MDASVSTNELVIESSRACPAQARAMAVLTLGFSMGTVAGPALGGLLAEPCDVFGDGFPFCGEHGLFAARRAHTPVSAHS